MSLVHSTVVVVPDDGTSPVGTDEWNADHIISGGVSGNLLFNNSGLVGEKTSAQVTASLDLFTSTLKGLTPPSGGGTTNFLRADGTWTAPAGAGGASVTISPTAPVGPSVGNLWWDSTGGQLYIYYDDSTSQQWVVTVNAGIGNVSSSGTPVNGQWAQWTDATHIQGVATASMPFVQKTGDTMTGDLTINKANGALILNKPASGSQSSVAGQTNGLSRWLAFFGDTAAESGSNAGSNFSLWRANDAGILTDAPLSITRSTGATTLRGDLTIDRANPIFSLRKAASGQGNYIIGYTGAIARWQMLLGDNTSESGSNVGSDFSFIGFTDAGGVVNIPIFIKRATGTIALGGLTNGNIDLDQGGISIRSSSTVTGICMRGMTAAGTNGAMNFLNAAGTAVGSIWITDTATAFNTASDIRLKDGVHEYTDGRTTLDQIKIIQFNWKQDGSGGVGISAQQAQPYYPRAVVEGKGELGKEGFMPWSVDYSKYVPLLIQALQDAHRRIDALEQRIAS